MSIVKPDIVKYTKSHTSSPPDVLQDFSLLLKENGVAYSPYEFYWLVGTITKVQGWIIHLSVIKTQLLRLLELIIPELIKSSVPFKIIQNYETAVNMLEGTLGYTNVGKLICIYPDNDIQASSIAQQLIAITYAYKGPRIPTDLNLGSIVYTRYGSFNPLLKLKSDGTVIKQIYDAEGNLKPDPYTIPFSIPQNIKWPFPSICQPIQKPTSRLLNNRYYPVATVKKDAKGNVIKALYFQRHFYIRPCIIKQGRANMGSDEAERDIRERLKWQSSLYKDLYNHIPMPAIIDSFVDNTDFHLVMEYIKGVTLHQWQKNLYEGRAWFDLTNHEKITVINCLLQLLSIISQFHSLGFIHRDITTENILIDKKGKLFLIDMELAWSETKRYPMPPFAQGTPGFMSPEQARTDIPTFKEDIYTLGCVMIDFFTNLSPNKWNQSNLNALRTSLPGIIGQKQVANAVCDCVHPSPCERPDLSKIVKVISLYKSDLQEDSNKPKKTEKVNKISVDEVKFVIQKGINGLSDNSLLSEKGHWLSMAERNRDDISNVQVEAAIVPGWHTGIAGPMWLIAYAKKLGFDSSHSELVYYRNWEYLKRHRSIFLEGNNPGLFHGSAGIALAISEGLKCGLLQEDDQAKSILNKCFVGKADRLDLASGISGQGLAALHCATTLEATTVQDLTSDYLALVVSSQQRNGSWKLHTTLELDDGHIGILLFLISNLKASSSKSTENCLLKGLDWLLTNGFDKRSIYKYNNRAEVNSSLLGVLVVLIRSYDLLRNVSFKQIAEANLSILPKHYTNFNFTLQSGMAGLGEVLLEAFTVFENSQWTERADWIIKMLLLTFQNSDQNMGFWLPMQNMQYSSDLFKGTTGILHYALRWWHHQTQYRFPPTN